MSWRLTKLAAWLALACVASAPAGGDSNIEADGPLPADQGLRGPEVVIHRALRRKVKTDFRETPLREVVDALQSRLGVTVILDGGPLDDAGIAADTPVTLEVAGLSGRSALELILVQVDLRWIVQGNALLITTPAAAEESCDERTYDVADLVHGVDEDGAPDFEPLIGALTACIEPASWESSGGDGQIEPADAVGAKALVVVQTQAVHERIRGLLADVRRCRGKLIRPAYPAHPAEAAIRRTLDKRLTLSFKKTPLDEVAAALEEKLGAPVLLDRRTLEGANIAADTPVTFAVSGISGRAALNHLLRPLGLTWTIRHEVLFVTTLEEAERRLETRIYDVADLAGNGATSPVMLGGGPSSDLGQLGEVIANCVTPTSWDQVGGPGTIVPLEDAGLQVLVITQRQDVLESVETLLADLRKLRETVGAGACRPVLSGRHDPAQKDSRRDASPVVNTSAERNADPFSAALAKCVSLDLADTPLEEAVARLSKAAGVPILIDRKALEDERIGLDTPITARLADVPLRSALWTVCETAGVEWTVEDEVILVTTAEVLEQRGFATRVYDAARAAGKDPMGNPDVDALIEAVTDAVRPESWDVQGGPGCIQSFVLPELSALVVEHHWHAREDVADFLAGQRK